MHVYQPNARACPRFIRRCDTSDKKEGRVGVLRYPNIDSNIVDQDLGCIFAGSIGHASPYSINRGVQRSFH